MVNTSNQCSSCEGHMILWSPSSTWKSSVSTRSPPVMSGLCLTMRVASHKPGGSIAAHAPPHQQSSPAQCTSRHSARPSRSRFGQQRWSRKCTCCSWTSRSDSTGHNELEKPCMITAKRLDVLSSTNKENNLLPLINMKRMQSKIL